MREELEARAVGVLLAPFTTLRVGGSAAQFVEVATDDEFVAAVADADDRRQPLLLIAGGSNLVIGDNEFPGLVVRIRTRGIDINPVPNRDEVFVRVAAGEPWDRLVAQLVSDGYSGVEALSGIPGSTGATPVQNVGAYGRDVADVIDSVEVFDRHTGTRESFVAADCEFTYRNSIFKRNPDRWLILAVTFRLAEREESAPVQYAELAKALGIAPGDTTKPIQVRREVMNVRRRKGMLLDIDDHDCWSAGSFFTNPIVAREVANALPEAAPRWPTENGYVKLSAAWLIEHSGFERGFSTGGNSHVSLSHKHTLAITNRGGATAADVVELARTIRDGVLERTGVELTPEPRLIGCSI